MTKKSIEDEKYNRFETETEKAASLQSSSCCNFAKQNIYIQHVT